ncbi:MAG: GNAT family N-acetyltransferase [Methylobacterium sp.]|nr:MAG: GNAT family N-acetyltransferase [Methylobacterium sp.]
MIVLDHEKLFDVGQRETLLDHCFGPARWQKTCELLRHGRLPSPGLAFVARADDLVVGTVRLWDVAAGNAPFLMLGPLAVSPACRSLGLGRQLMARAISQARSLGHRAMFLVGDEPYYARFGFRADLTDGLALPGPVDRRRFLGLELQEGGFAGLRGLIRPTGAVPLRPAGTDAARAWRAVA